MTFVGFNMLASGDDAIAKLILAAIVFVLWGIGALASALKKSAEQARQRRLAGELPLELTRRMETGAARRQPPRLQSLQSAPAVWPPPPPAIGPQGFVATKRAPARAAPRIPVAAAAAAARTATAPPPLPPVRPVAPAVAAAPRATRPTPTAATTGLRALLRPDSLRTQVVMMEVLGKPLALRDLPFGW